MGRYYNYQTTDSSRFANLSPVTWLLAGVAIGAALMYALDPNQGNRRRAMVKDKARSLGTKASRKISATTRDLSNRAQGLRHEATKAMGKLNGSKQTSTVSGGYGSGAGAGDMSSGGSI